MLGRHHRIADYASQNGLFASRQASTRLTPISLSWKEVISASCFRCRLRSRQVRMDAIAARHRACVCPRSFSLGPTPTNQVDSAELDCFIASSSVFNPQSMGDLAHKVREVLFPENYRGATVRFNCCRTCFDVPRRLSSRFGGCADAALCLRQGDAGGAFLCSVFFGCACL